MSVAVDVFLHIHPRSIPKKLIYCLTDIRYICTVSNLRFGIHMYTYKTHTVWLEITCPGILPENPRSLYSSFSGCVSGCVITVRGIPP